MIEQDATKLPLCQASTPVSVDELECRLYLILEVVAGPLFPARANKRPYDSANRPRSASGIRARQFHLPVGGPKNLASLKVSAILLIISLTALDDPTHSKHRSQFDAIDLAIVIQIVELKHPIDYGTIVTDLLTLIVAIAYRH